MGIGAGLYMYDVVVEKFTFAISSPDEFLFVFHKLNKKAVLSQGTTARCRTESLPPDPLATQ